MFEAYFIRKANVANLNAILEKENFIFTKNDVEALLKGNQRGTRYGNIVLERREGEEIQKRFFKVMLDGTRRTYYLFRRQVEISKALHEDAQFTQPTVAVVTSSLKSPVPYVIFETRETGVGFGFQHDSPDYYETTTQDEVRKLVDVIYDFHQAGASLEKKALAHAQHVSSCMKDYERECVKLLRTTVLHKSSEHIFEKKRVDDLLKSYLAIPDAELRIQTLLRDAWQFVNKSKSGKKYLVHADMQIDNVYKHRNGAFELLDFEWVGVTDNPVIPIMFDYGNLRARAWSSPRFQKALDIAMREKGIERYNDAVMIDAAMKLGVLRSSLMMARFHMDFENTVNKDKRTEADYFKMYPKTLESLARVLK